MREKKPCPECGSMKLRVMNGPMGGHWVKCMACGHRGKERGTGLMAIDSWNKEPRR